MTDSNFFRPWTTPFLRKLLQAASAHGVPESVRMNAHDYADIRMFCRDFLDLNIDPAVLKTGFVSTFEGVRLFADRTISAGTMRVLDADGRDLIHSVASPDVSPAVFHSGSLAVCPDGLCIVQAVMHA